MTHLKKLSMLTHIKNWTSQIGLISFMNLSFPPTFMSFSSLAQNPSTMLISRNLRMLAQYSLTPSPFCLVTCTVTLLLQMKLLPMLFYNWCMTLTSTKAHTLWNQNKWHLPFLDIGTTKETQWNHLSSGWSTQVIMVLSGILLTFAGMQPIVIQGTGFPEGSDQLQYLSAVKVSVYLQYSYTPFSHTALY